MTATQRRWRDSGTCDTTFTVWLEPIGKGAARFASHGGKPRSRKDKVTEWWMATFRARAELHRPDELLDRPVRIDVLAVFPRLQEHDHSSWPNGLIWKDTKPDDDNVAKAVKDAFSEKIPPHTRWWVDDSRVCLGIYDTCYAERDGDPRVVVRLRTSLPPADVVAQTLGLKGPTLPIRAPAGRLLTRRHFPKRKRRQKHK